MIPAYQQFIKQIGPAIEQATPQYLHTMENLPQFSFADKANAGVMGNAVLGTAQGIGNATQNVIGGSTRLGEQIGNGTTGQGFNWQQVGQGGQQLGNGFLNTLIAQGALSGAGKVWDATPFSDASIYRDMAADKAAGNVSSEGLVKDALGWRDPLNGKYAQTTDVVELPSQGRTIPNRYIPVKQGGQIIKQIPMNAPLNVAALRQVIKNGVFIK